MFFSVLVEINLKHGTSHMKIYGHYCRHLQGILLTAHQSEKYFEESSIKEWAIYFLSNIFYCFRGN